ncbi:alpha/beta fold hydrolase [Chitinophaga flava]|uniref:Alpha/beta hydrolase n=1 Tax=Chitinophaga flava TaxID=2259036 RepID=A0A365XZP8_9BACT|nr:alpha/beta hydrolase [Chitinophaga flava]RBL91730.1 alpha/beta hydrolase [Chitinophaga flava]
MLKDVIISGVSLKVKHKVEAADRPTIVFLHDSLGCIDLWRDFPEKLGKETHCNILVYDRQGYGQSGPFTDLSRGNNYLEKEADVLHELIQQTGIRQAILFGHSDGASIALIAAAKYPAAIIGLITEGAHIFVEDITLKGIRDAVVAYRTTNLKEKLTRYHGVKMDAVFAAWADTWLSETFKSWNIEKFLPQIICPILVIQGEHDEFGSMKQVTGIINQVSGKSTQLIMSSVGHTPHKEAGDEVLYHVVVFVKSVYSIP